MNYFNSCLRLAHGFFAMRKYKRMHPALAVLSFIVVLPLFVAFIIYLGMGFVTAILFSFFELPIKYLHKILREEGAVVKTPTQFIVYFFAWPFVFFLYCLYAITSFLFNVTYFIAQVYGYLASLGGYYFHIRHSEENITLEDSKKRYLVEPIILISFYFVCDLVLGITSIIIYSSLYANYEEATFPVKIAPVVYSIVGVYILFLFIFIPIAFRNKKDTVEIEEIKEEEKEEE